MKIFVIYKDQAGYYTGTSGKSNKGNKIPVFSNNENKAKIFKLLSHARIARNKMGKFEKISNVDILEYDTVLLGEH